MGKTVPAYRMVLEEEISRWSCFVRALRKPDRELCLGVILVRQVFAVF
jgi:hypothetical protein